MAFEITEPKVEPDPDPGTPQPGTRRHEPAGHQPAGRDAARQADRGEAQEAAGDDDGKFAKQGLKVSTACEAGFTGKPRSA